MKNIRFKEKAAAILCCLSLTAIYTQTVYANELDQTVLVTGTKTLLTAITGILTVLALSITIAISVINGIAWQNSDEHDKAAKKRKFILDIGIGIVIICVGGLITAIFSIYGYSG